MGVSQPLQGLTWVGRGSEALAAGREARGELVGYSQRPYLEAVEERIKLTVRDVPVQLPCNAQRGKLHVPGGQM